MSEHWKRSNRPIDDVESVASANEWTGMLPAMPADEDTQPVRRMMNVHPQPKPGKFRPTVRWGLLHGFSYARLCFIIR